jgi:hypothetical protein
MFKSLLCCNILKYATEQPLPLASPNIQAYTVCENIHEIKKFTTKNGKER